MMFSLQLNHRVIKDLSRTLCFQKPAEESAHFRSESSKPQKIGPKVFLEKKKNFPSQDIVVIVTDLKRNGTRTSHWMVLLYHWLTGGDISTVTKLLCDKITVTKSQCDKIIGNHQHYRY